MEYLYSVKHNFPKDTPYRRDSIFYKYTDSHEVYGLFSENSQGIRLSDTRRLVYVEHCLI